MVLVDCMWFKTLVGLSEANKVGMEKSRKFLSKKPKAMDYSQLLVISLGAGSRNLENKYCAEVAAKWNILEWMVQVDTGIPALLSSPFINLVSSGMADMVDYHISTIFQSLNVGENYLRIQVTQFPDVPYMHDSTSINIYFIYTWSS